MSFGRQFGISPKKRSRSPTSCRVFYDGRSFDSGAERRLYMQYQLEEKAGETVIEKCQDVVTLIAGIRCRPDFKLRDPKTGEIYWGEMKGFEQERWRYIKALWKFCGPGRMDIWKVNHRGLYLAETVIPIDRPDCDCECHR